MATVMSVTITLGEPRVGGWCSDCLLPSVVEVDLYVLTADGVSPCGCYRGCTDCGRCRW